MPRSKCTAQPGSFAGKSHSIDRSVICARGPRCFIPSPCGSSCSAPGPAAASGEALFFHVGRAAVPQGLPQRAAVPQGLPLRGGSIFYCVAHCFFGCRRFKPKQGQLSHRHCGRKRAFGSIVGTSSGRALFRWHRFSSSMLQAAGEGEVVVVATAGFATSGGCPGPPAWTLRDRSSAKSTAKGVLCLFAACQVQRHGGPRAVSGGRAAMPPPKTGRRARGTATFPGTCKTA